LPKPFPRGRICWTELTTTDPKAAQAFYKATVGWGTQPWDMDPSYVMWTARGTPVGGLMALSDEARQMGTPPSWAMSVAVPDVDASVRQAVSLGARVSVQPQDIPTMGRFAVLRDPQGATFALFSSTTEIPGHDGPSQACEFSWHELATTEQRAAWEFYEQLFGWVKMDAMDMGPAGTYQMFGRAGQMLGAMYPKPPEMTGPSNWLPYALVPNADSAATVVQRLGGKVTNGPMDIPGGRIAQCLDPQGAAFALHSYTAPAKAEAEKAKKKAAKNVAKAAKKAERKTAPRGAISARR
jgi:predicted enzyme related to lactoylglutathione lyase